MTRHIAIIGCGPAGIYTAERLGRVAKDDRIDVIDRLPAPFGLVRYGVAPDHQSTKAIARTLARALTRDNVGFIGNVEIGKQISLAEVRAHYDAVVLATGAPLDRRLGIPGEDLPGVQGSIRFVGWYNAHPDHADLAPDLAGVAEVVVIGAGNVALDVARVIAKTEAELASADLDPEALGRLAAMPLKRITIAARRGLDAVKFTPIELEEMGNLAQARPVVDPADLPPPPTEGAEDKVTALLRGFAAVPADDPRPVEIRFAFNLTPAAFEGEDRLEAVRFDGPDGPVTLPAQLAVSCIGYNSIPCDDRAPERGCFANEDGRIEDGLYVVGWAKRGPSGTIPTNRKEAHEIADRLVAEIADNGRDGADGLLALLDARGVRPVAMSDWERIDAAEMARAIGTRPRHKFGSVAEMLAALD
ncbi:MAG: FAD-dependent oxidoreductase [Azospirillaceae bacterium]